MDFESVIRNATIVDGTGRARFQASIGIRDGRITAVTRGELPAAAHIIDATGLVVTPGFIDAHSHVDWILPLADHEQILAPLVAQGVTTVVAGQCGFSPAPANDPSILLLDAFSAAMRDTAFEYRWRSFGEFLNEMERGGLFLNAAFLAGHGSIRYAVMGDSSARPTPDQIEGLCRLARQAVRDGAIGVSAGLAYAPGIFSDNDELQFLLHSVAEEGAVFTVHGRAYSWVSPFYKPMIGGAAHNLRSVRELIGLAEEARVRIQLSHQIFVGRRTWRTYRAVLREIEQAADRGVDVAFDAYPYTCGNTIINVVFPEWFLAGFERNISDPRALRRVKREMDILRLALGLDYDDISLLWAGVPELAELEGMDFDTISRRLGMPHFDAYMHVARLSHGQARTLLYTYSGDESREEPLQAALAHPLCAFMTDTILTRRGKANPASYGTFPRLLGRYSRDVGLFTLEEAVRRMTSFPAERMGLKDIGRIAEGYYADLVLLDAARVADHTTRQVASTPPGGIRAVLISGEVVAEEGRLVIGPRRGRVLRR